MKTRNVSIHQSDCTCARCVAPRRRQRLHREPRRFHPVAIAIGASLAVWAAIIAAIAWGTLS